MPKTPSPPLPLKVRLLSAAVTSLTDAACRRDGSVNRRLLSLINLTQPPNPVAVSGVATSDHVVDPSRDLWLRLFSPSAGDARTLPLVLYFHGGGFAFHSAALRPYDALCRRLARRIPALVASVDYRLAPEHRFPAPYDDGVDALRWIDDNGSLVPDLSDVFIFGDSAGGNIAHHVSRRATTSRPLRRASVAGVVAIQPFFGGQAATASEERLDGVPFGRVERFEWMWRSFLPEGADRNHEAANVFGPGSRSSSEDWKGFPPAMVCVGGWDPLQDRQRWYYEGLRKKGVDARLAEYPDAIHGFFAFPELPEARKLIDDIGAFVRQHRRSPAADAST